MKIAILSNCQNVGIAVSLRALLPEAEVLNFEIARHQLEPQRQHETAAALASCDNVFSAETSPKFGPIATHVLRHTVKRLHLLPAFAFGGFHPDTIGITIDGQQLGGPTGGYQSRLAVIGYLAGLSAVDTASLFNRLVFSRLGYLRAYAEQSVLLSRYLARYGMNAAPLQAAWLRHGCFMHAMNHPKIRVLLDIARHCCGLIGIAPTNLDVRPEDLPDNLEVHPIHPLLPDIAAAVGVAPEGMFRGGLLPGVPNPGMSTETFVDESFLRFASVPLELLRRGDGVMAGLAALGLRERPPPRTVRKPEQGMALLTWHGTLLREPGPHGTVSHLPVTVPANEHPLLKLDFPASVPDRGTDRGTDRAMPHGFESPVLGGVRVQPGGGPALVSLWRGERVLCPERDINVVDFSRDQVGDWEGLLPVTLAEVAVLRTLLSHDWLIEASGEAVPRDALLMRPGFVLMFGDRKVRLLSHFPVLETPATEGAARVTLLLDGEVAVVRAAGAASRYVPDAAALALGEQVVVAGPPALLHLPLVVCDTDRRWLFDAYVGPQPVPVGWQRYGGVLCRASGAALRFLADGSVQPVADPASASDAPEVAGRTVLAEAAGGTARAGWAAAALRLFVLGPYLDATTRILAPPDGVADAVMRAWQAIGVARGLVAAPAALCRAADMAWLAQEHVGQLPTEVLHAFRDQARRAAAPQSSAGRVFVHGLGPAAADPALLAEVENQGFRPIDLGASSPLAQLSVFAAAGWVMGDGADLAGLLFCAPGTRVLELAPTAAFSPFTWMTAAKLGLLHAVLPRGSKVDGTRLGALLAMLSALAP